MSSLTSVLPKHVTPERLVKVVLSATMRTPALRDCSIQSVALCVMQAGELGLDLGGKLGEAYMVPFKNEAQFIVGYKGLIKLARQSGQLISLAANLIHEAEKGVVEIDRATAIVKHPLVYGADASPIIGAYALAILRDGARQLDYMSKDEIDAIRARSRAGRNGPWVTDYGQMARKTVIRRLMNYLPLSTELQRAIEYDRELDDDEASPENEHERAKALAGRIRENVLAQAEPWVAETEGEHVTADGEVVES